MHSLHRTFPPSHDDATEINNYHSVMAAALLRFTHRKWQFYINHVSDILWDGWAYLPGFLCTVSVVCVQGGGRGPVSLSIFSVDSDADSTYFTSLISMAEVSLYLLKDYEMDFFICAICIYLLCL